MAFSVGELAKRTGVTARALHDDDEVGIVRPSDRSEVGHWLYEQRDVMRLQQVLLYRELGLPLEQIAAVLDDPGFSRGAAFYPCSVEMHGKLAEMYVGDPRFSANLDKVAPGFAQYLRDAIVASSSRNT